MVRKLLFEKSAGNFFWKAFCELQNSIKQYQQVQGFFAYLLAATGLLACWLWLLQQHEWCWKLWRLSSSPFQVKLPAIHNWAADASDLAIVVVDGCGFTRAWQQNWLTHINLAELYGLWMVASIVPLGMCIWNDSRVALLGRRGCFWLEVAAELDALAFVKGLSFQWLPSVWNLADKASQCHWGSP